MIEELKKCNYVKVIILVNENGMSDNAKDILKKYEEKVIDRTYHITKIPSKINWGNLGIHASFMQDFIKKHYVENIRTLQKAQNFYDDVSIHMKSIKNEEFAKEVRLICFAIVIESVEANYFNDNIKASAENNKRTLEGEICKQITNSLDHRIKNNYLSGIRSGAGLFHLLLKYYNNETDLNEELIKAENQVFLHVGAKPVFYMTEPEAKKLLAEWEKNLDSVVTIGELNKLYNIKFFPVKDMSDDKRFACYNVMRILYCEDSDRFLEYCGGIECDRMAKYRIEKLVEEIVRNY